LNHGSFGSIIAPVTQRAALREGDACWRVLRDTLTLLGLVLVPAVAAATNHLTRIEQVMAGANGDSNVQFIEIKAALLAQNLWGPQTGDPDFPEPRALLTFHDASGAQVAEFGFPSNPVLGPADPDNGGHSVLIATQAFADLTGLAPDFLMPPDLPTQDGMVCFTDNPENSVLFEVNACLSYGNYAGPLEQDACAGDNGSPAAALVIAGPTPLSLDRFQNDGPTDAFGCHVNADFELHSPEPRNTAGETATIAPLSEIEQGENLFNLERFNGNGRTCASCHLPEDDFGITPQTIASLFASDPADALFVAENNPQLSMLENACLMREGDQRGLILENIDGFENPPVFRNSPHLLNIALTAPYGLSGHVPDLIEFSEAAVLQHAPRMLGRNTDPTLGPVDVRLPTDFELQALQTFQDAIVFPADGNLSLTRMINFHIQTNGADSAAIGRGFSLFFGATGSAQCCQRLPRHGRGQPRLQHGGVGPARER
jgi:hypothetical protein